jgi:hypothetical protein
MKIKTIHIITPLILLAFSSCASNDEYKGTFEMSEERPVFNVSDPAGAKAQEMYTEYGVIFRPGFTFEEFYWDWNNTLSCYPTGTTGFRYTDADPAYAAEVMDSVESWVFDVFPKSFVQGNMPIKILMADTLCNRFSYRSAIVVREWDGNITANYTIIGYTSSRFTQLKSQRALVENWLSLFVEKMVNSGRLSVPARFTELSATGFAKASFTNSEDVVANYGILRKSRKKQNTGSTTASWYKTEPAQDFGDFVAFIVYTPDNVKQTYYAKNEVVLVKENIVKDYFKEAFNVELPRLPR